MKEKNTECNCNDWKENINKVNAGNTIMALRSGGCGYTGKQFVFCPWCATSLRANNKKENPKGDYDDDYVYCSD